VVGEEVDGPAHVTTGPVGGHRLHQLAGLVHLGVLGQIAVVEVGGEGDEPFGGETVGHLLDARVESPPLLDDDQTGPGARCGDGQVPGCTGAVAREVHDLSCEITHVPNGRRWSAMCHTLTS
jgi:hypothetical protein